MEVEVTGGGERRLVRGVPVGGIPVGEAAYIREMLRVRAEEVVSDIDTSVAQLHHSPHHEWSSPYYCLQPIYA